MCHSTFLHTTLLLHTAHTASCQELMPLLLLCFVATVLWQVSILHPFIHNLQKHNKIDSQ